VTLKNQNSDEYILKLIQMEGKVDEGMTILIKKHQEIIYSHVRRMLSGHEDTADVVQNIFIKAYQGIGKFEGKSKLSTWLYRIATNETLTFIRKNKNRQSFSNENSLSLLQADAYVEESDIIRMLKKAINQLPERQKLVFNLRYFDEMPYEEMSKILSVKVGGLKASFHHAVKKIESYVRENQMK